MIKTLTFFTAFTLMASAAFAVPQATITTHKQLKTDRTALCNTPEGKLKKECAQVAKK